MYQVTFTMEPVQSALLRQALQQRKKRAKQMAVASIADDRRDRAAAWVDDVEALDALLGQLDQARRVSGNNRINTLLLCGRYGTSGWVVYAYLHKGAEHYPLVGERNEVDCYSERENLAALQEAYDAVLEVWGEEHAAPLSGNNEIVEDLLQVMGK